MDKGKKLTGSSDEVLNTPADTATAGKPLKIVSSSSGHGPKKSYGPWELSFTDAPNSFFYRPPESSSDAPSHIPSNPMNLELHMKDERSRVVGLTPEEIEWRKKWVLDQKLHPDEPVYVESAMMHLNPIRRLYRYPWDSLERKVLIPALGLKKGHFVRIVVPKIFIGMLTTLCIYYHVKYNKPNWMNRIRSYHHFPRSFIRNQDLIERDYPGLLDKAFPIPKEPKDFYDLNFSRRVTHLDVGPPTLEYIPAVCTDDKKKAIMKEAVAICVDIGPGMRERTVAKGRCLLGTVLRCVQWIVQRRIFSESKDELALILYNTADSKNPLSDIDKNKYSNISLMNNFQVSSWELFSSLNSIETTSPALHSIDFLKVLQVCIHCMDEKTLNEKFQQKSIVLFSSFDADIIINKDDMDNVTKAIKQHQLELAFISCNNDLCASNVEEDNYPKAWKYAKEFITAVDGIYCNLNDALNMLGSFQRRSIRSVPWKCNLEFGTILQIPICMYLKCKCYKLNQTWKWAFAENPYVDVKFERAYVKSWDDEDELLLSNEEIISSTVSKIWSGVEVDSSYLVKAFRFGSSVVPLNKFDLNEAKYKDREKCFKVLGFFDRCMVKQWHFAGDGTHFVFGDPKSATACQAFSALIHSCKSNSKVILVRYAYNVASNPKIGVLIPLLKDIYECFVFVILPFEEDLIIVDQKSIGEFEKCHVTDEQLEAVDKLIDAMNMTDLSSSASSSGDGIFKWSKVKNPYYQNLFRCMTFRALQPKEKLPFLRDDLLEDVQPNVALFDNAKNAFDVMRKNFILEKVENAKGKRTAAEVFKNELCDAFPAKVASFQAIDEKIVRMKIGTVNPVQDFIEISSQIGKNQISEGKKFVYLFIFIIIFILFVCSVCEQMKNVILAFVQESNDDIFYDKALHCCAVLRPVCIKQSLPDLYNTILRQAKCELVLGKQKNFWLLLKNKKDSLGLITVDECQSSSISQEDAVSFYSEEVSDEIMKNNPQLPDSTDLIDELE
ncbi:X-ray repair cross-complementing protein 5 [Trichinella nelsoni]|uniref:X-ray repair cross-complementing protein 5 n=1 Tax=Trichinella nelsoni TaxID=6336 RepID=A0A0V0S1X5_9BILA|nr:X-ray repair cross-complementing protein 5 [Trichinella nelsoni]